MVSQPLCVVHKIDRHNDITHIFYSYLRYTLWIGEKIDVFTRMHSP
ncbi:UNVERIFIED_ORG: hypothetical protein M2414_005206 [Rahnella aquatilis]|jgi:hypothetical protein|nr:hypothetical protein [Rahnella aquatilis]RKT75124.1 hypothetical protein BJ925_3163 [Rahnella aquatilis]